MFKKNTIILVGTFSSLNKGDAALQYSTIDYINKNYPEYNVKLFSNFIKSDAQEYKSLKVELIKTHRRNLFLYIFCILLYRYTNIKLLREIKHFEKAKLVIDLSGDTYSDYFGKLVPLSKALTLFLAKRNNVKYYFLSQSMGPFKDQFKFVKKIITDGEKIFLREKESITYVNQLTQNYEIFKDVAFNLPTDYQFGEDYINNILDYKNCFVIGINTSYRFINSNNNNLYINLQKLKQELSYSINKKIIFIGIPHSFGPKKSQNDILAIKQFYKNKESSNYFMIEDSNITCTQLKGIVYKLDFVISARMHLSIACISQQIPSFSLANSHKYYGVLEDFLSSEEIFDANNADSEALLIQIRNAILKREKQKNLIKSNLSTVKKLSKMNFESVFKIE